MCNCESSIGKWRSKKWLGLHAYVLGLTKSSNCEKVTNIHGNSTGRAGSF